MKRDGFSFPNYSNEKAPINLTSAAMTAIFGDKACARVTAGGCTLTAPAAAWLALNNQEMNGGHCFGMAAAAALLFTDVLKVKDFGANSTFALKDDGRLQELIARLYVTQSTEPESTSAKEMTVRQAIAAIGKDWTDGKLPLLAIRTADKSGGHAVTPIAFRKLDDSKIGLVVYDNNVPGEERLITLDPAANSWSYATATDPTKQVIEFAGGADNPLTLFSTTASAQTQQCPFCRDNDNPYVYAVLNPESAEGGVRLSVTDVNGRPLPGVDRVPWLSDDDGGGSGSGQYVRVPTGKPFRVVMTGTDVKAGAQVAAQLSVVGTGWTDAVAAVQMSRGESDSITVDPSNGSFSYATTDGESPILGNTVDEGGTSYSFRFQGARIDADGGSFQVSADPATHVERIASVGTGASTMGFVFQKIDGTMSQTFRTGKLQIASGQALLAGYGAWSGDGRPLTVAIAAGATGQIQRQVELIDQ